MPATPIGRHTWILFYFLLKQIKKQPDKLRVDELARIIALSRNRANIQTKNIYVLQVIISSNKKGEL